MSTQIELIDTRTADEAKLERLHRLYLEWDSEWSPHDPPMPLARRLAEWRNLRELEDVPRWVAWEGDRAIGTTGLYHHRTQDLTNTWSWVFVTADRRRRGLGSALFREPTAYSLADNRERIACGVLAGDEARAFPERLGMSAVYNERVSQLRIADLDLDLLRIWVERARERARDYEVVFLPMPIPEEYRAQMVKVLEVMNTAPLEDLEEDPLVWDDEMLRDLEESEERKQNLIYTLVARHKPTGDLVGLTTLSYQRLYPEKAQQMDTGVDPGHRNLGLGRWLKAAMMLRFVEEHPEVRVVETENADSNEPMLNINVEMGFRPARHQIIFQGPSAVAMEHLDRVDAST